MSRIYIYIYYISFKICTQSENKCLLSLKYFNCIATKLSFTLHVLRWLDGHSCSNMHLIIWWKYKSIKRIPCLKMWKENRYTCMRLENETRVSLCVNIYHSKHFKKIKFRIVYTWNTSDTCIYIYISFNIE